MRFLRALAVRIAGPFRARRTEADFAAELESHVALHREDGIRAGLTPVEAHRQALLRLGVSSRRARRIASAGRCPGLKTWRWMRATRFVSCAILPPSPPPLFSCSDSRSARTQPSLLSFTRYCCANCHSTIRRAF